MQSYKSVCSTTITGVFEIGSFSKLPVSIIALVSISTLLIFIFIVQNMSFFDILDFTNLKDVTITTNATIVPNIIVFKGYVPKNRPFFIKISCGFTI